MIGKKGLKPLSTVVLKEIKIKNKKSKAKHVLKKKKIKARKTSKKSSRPRVIKTAKRNIVKAHAELQYVKPSQPPIQSAGTEPAKPYVEPKEYPLQDVMDNIKIKNFSSELSYDVKPIKSPSGIRVPTGIPGLDEVMGGGYELYSNNLVGGGAGSGKSIFSIQFLVTGIVKYNEPGVYITFEEKKENVYKHMLQFGWDLAKYERDGKFAFVEYTPEQVRKMLEEGGGLIESIIQKIKARRVVLDSISAFGLLFRDEITRRQATLALFDLIRKWGATAILTAEFEPEIEKPSTTQIEFEVDSIILLYYPRQGDIRKRALEILKMRGTEHSKKIFPMKITDAGITIYPKERIF